MPDAKIPNLKDFSAYVDENGQSADLEPNEVGNAAELQSVLKGKPDGESETARVASGSKNDDATAETEAEIPAANLDHISNPHIERAESPLDKATSVLGSDKA